MLLPKKPPIFILKIGNITTSIRWGGIFISTLYKKLNLVKSLSIKNSLSMFAKIKQAFFTDSLTIEWNKVTTNPLKCVLKNDQGEICSTLETTPASNQKYFNWRGLNDLPYGRYFLELSNTEGDQLLKLVKRV